MTEQEKDSLQEAKNEAMATTEKKPKKNNAEEEKMTPLELIKVVVTALVLAILLKTFVVGNFWIPSESMVPTIQVNDKVIVTNFSYWFHGPERGDVVVFKYPKNTKKDYIKRCIGLPGEIIEFRDSKLYVDGVLTAEDYLPEGLQFDDYGPVLVPENSYFMCGDNRNNSADSRAWGFVEKKYLIGKAQFIYWPFSDWRTL